MIDLIFDKNKPKEKIVLDDWKIFLDHINTPAPNPEDQNYESRIDTWAAKTNECEINLLYAMSQSLGYDFDIVQLKKGYYAPQGHADLELDQLIIRNGMAALLSGRSNLPVKIVLDKSDSTGEEPTPLGS